MHLTSETSDYRTIPAEVAEIRFDFGANWTRFLAVVSEKHIEAGGGKAPVPGWEIYVQDIS